MSKIQLISIDGSYDTEEVEDEIIQDYVSIEQTDQEYFLDVICVQCAEFIEPLEEHLHPHDEKGCVCPTCFDTILSHM